MADDPGRPSTPKLGLGPSPAQAWSAAIQNVVALICLTVSFLSEKIEVTWYLILVGLIVGVDFLGRKKLPGSLGVVGVFSNLWPHLAVVLAFASVSGCGSAQITPASVFDALKGPVSALCQAPEAAAACFEAHEAILDAKAAISDKDVMAKAAAALEAVKHAYTVVCGLAPEPWCDDVRDGLNKAIAAYDTVNAALQPDAGE